jgi:23S rRNA (uracil1939-C5)-methyltransferase
MEPIVGMEDPYRYRNKAQFPFGTDSNGKIITGFYASRTHAIVPNEDCLLGVTENEEILNVFLSYMKRNGIKAYDEKTRKGLIRHVLIRKGFETDQLMVCPVINGDSLPAKNQLIAKLQEIEGMTSISYSVNKENTNVIMGKTVETIFGPGYIEDTIGDIKFQISPNSFYQVNPVQTKNLYDCALKYADLKGAETVWDLYCGIGTISLFLTQKAKQVYGIESIEETINDARNNAKINGITNAEFFVGKVEELLPKMWEENKKASASEKMCGDVIMIDPPRKGCDPKCLETILEMQPEKIVYVSCDSATLARDLAILCEKDYTLEKAQCYDMFPHTIHVETVVALYRKNI